MKRLFFPKKLVVPAIPDSLPIIRNFISQVGNRYRFSQHEINAFKISIDEACTNIIKHGYKNIHPPGNITMKVFVNQDRLIVELIDQGKSFDPGRVGNPNVARYVENGRKGGLGIYIMRKFLDAIEYEVTGIGNVLRLTKLRENRVTRPFIFPLISIFRRFKENLFLNRELS